MDAARRPPVDDFDGGDSGGGRVLITTGAAAATAAERALHSVKKQQQTNSRVAIQTNLINSCRYLNLYCNLFGYFVNQKGSKIYSVCRK